MRNKLQTKSFKTIFKKILSCFPVHFKIPAILTFLRNFRMNRPIQKYNIAYALY